MPRTCPCGARLRPTDKGMCARCEAEAITIGDLVGLDDTKGDTAMNMALIQPRTDLGPEALNRMLAQAARYLHEYRKSQMESNGQLRNQNGVLAAAKQVAAFEVIAAGAGFTPQQVSRMVNGLVEGGA